MPDISKKAASIPVSATRILVPFAKQAAAAGKEIIKLNIGQPDIASPQAAMAGLKSFDAKFLSYTDANGLQSYREKLVEYYAKFKINLTADEIVVTTSGSEAIQFAFLSCFDPGDEVIVFEPFYSNYNSIGAITDVKLVAVTSVIEDGFALPDVSEIEKLITDKTKGIVICNPNNPTGYVYSEEELEQLAKIVKAHDLFLISDEVYREFNYSDAPVKSVLELDGIAENAVMVDSVSKRYNFCGARIGCLATNNQKVIEAASTLAKSRLSPPVIGQYLSEIAIDTPDSYFAEVKQEYKKRRDFTIKRLNEIEGVVCPEPQGAFYCIAKLPVENAMHFCQWLLSDFDVEGVTVMFAPAEGFYATPNTGLAEIRIAYVVEVEQLAKAFEVLELALTKYPGIS